MKGWNYLVAPVSIVALGLGLMAAAIFTVPIDVRFQLMGQIGLGVAVMGMLWLVVRGVRLCQWHVTHDGGCQKCGGIVSQAMQGPYGIYRHCYMCGINQKAE